MIVKIARNIDAPASALWTYLADYANIHRFHPKLKGSNFIEGATTCEIGSTRQCDMKDGHFLKEKVIEWQEGSHYTVDIYETSMPMTSAKATLGVKPLGAQKAQAYMHLDITPKYKIMQPMMYLLFKYVDGPAILKGLEDTYLKERILQSA